ncbi:MAG: CDP-4-keto-6-deoxy-D-glucose-3-dehydrase [Betaproteobacteria bacterium TMED82]|nr:MAG: CDP-4-keto-6-deoxy-D-glucose-3-dehydrase [Betaproteobacteria bacterium TMED82]|tara:strand:- start:131310 stop:132482 length:1173 start_codon:yes stop_codon:yes gene_type:complete
MKNNFSREDLDLVILHLQSDDPKLTQGPLVERFESLWSSWLGVKHSVFVNSGSSANLLSIFSLKNFFPDGGEIILPPLTWSSDISSIIHAGFDPVFVDINPRTLGLDDLKVCDAISDRTVAIFVTHCQGFNALTDLLLEEIKKRNLWLLEDVCESHGATHRGKRLGAFGQLSNFSFYYAHHMSTIEGGMICTDSDDLVEIIRLLRSHGMTRELKNEEKKQKFVADFPDLNPDFIFAMPAFNVRNTEIGAILGINQLKRLDRTVIERCKNQEIFFSDLDSEFYRTDYLFEGSSNYALNIVLKKASPNLAEELKREMIHVGIENRRGSAGGGNQLRQPYLRKIFQNLYNQYPETDHIHFNGFYIGNYPGIEPSQLKKLAEFFNDFARRHKQS